MIQFLSLNDVHGNNRLSKFYMELTDLLQAHSVKLQAGAYDSIHAVLIGDDVYAIGVIDGIVDTTPEINHAEKIIGDLRDYQYNQMKHRKQSLDSGGDINKLAGKCN